jgi:hypothetical protein
MPTVVVVTRNPALAMGLRHHGYDVTDVRPDRHGEWTREARAAHAVVLELTDAVAAEAAVQRLRAERLGLPVLLVSNDSPGWETTAAHIGPAARVLPLPISLPTLLAAVDALIQEGPADLPPAPSNENELLSAVAASVGLAISESGTVVPDEGPARMPRVRPPADLTPPPRAEAAPEAAPEPEADPEPEVEPEPAPEPEPVTLAMALARAPGVPQPAQQGAAPTDRLVTVLIDRAGELNGLDECADVAVGELADRVGAEAVALLVPDDAGWRVAGGVGLRPLEHRVVVPNDHWLVSHVVTAGQGLLADDTDAGRDRLTGVPLAAWRRVLAVPVPDVGGILVAARAEEPFDAAALEVAAEVGREAGPLLRDAVAVRTLARALAPYADLPD